MVEYYTDITAVVLDEDEDEEGRYDGYEDGTDI